MTKNPTEMLKICGEFLGSPWNTVQEKDFTVTPILNGLTNYLFICSLNNSVEVQAGHERRVIIRFYGESLAMNDHLVLSDCIIFALLSEYKFGPRFFGFFPGGRIEQFIEESRVLSCCELSDPVLSSCTAKQLAKMHTFNLPLSKKPNLLFENMTNWISDINSAIAATRDDPIIEEKNVSLNLAIRKTMDEYKLSEQSDWARQLFVEKGRDFFPVVFCHNDLQENNLLYVKDRCNPLGFHLQSIDFEFAGYNFRGFDIGNHFCEWILDYDCSEWPKFKFNAEHFPSKEQQITFWKAYLGTENCSEDSTNYEKLYIEGLYGALLSHLYWAIWGFIQAKMSSIEFGYYEYSIKRLILFKNLKAQLPDIDTFQMGDEKSSSSDNY